MKIDFALILTSLTLLTGIIWLIDKLFFAKARKQAQQAPGGDEITEPVAVDWSRSLFPVLLFVLVLRSFLFEPFRIPSSSMMPTLLIGDFILVNKFAYGVRLPVLNTKIIDIGSPKRGDVIVFRYPGNGPNDPTEGTDYIKRVIGLPGDVIGIASNRVTINGTVLDYDVNGVYVGTGPSSPMTGSKQVSEKLPEGLAHAILDQWPDASFHPESNGEWTVPEGHFFMLGDNRDASLDSRYWGFVPEANLAGRASLIWLNCSNWFCKDSFEYSRIGDTIN